MRKHAMTMAKIVNERMFKRIIEVGVYKGRFCGGLNWVCPHITNYIGIDTWADFHNPEYLEENMAKMTNEDWIEAYLECCRSTMVYPQIKLIRANANDVAKIIPNKSVDMVFIDADHSYEAVLNDLKVWTPKVRRGGIMSGHDFIKHHTGVKRAVIEFFGDRVDRLPATCWKVEI